MAKISESLYAPYTLYESFDQFQKSQLTTGDIVEFPFHDSLTWYYVYNNQLIFMDKQYFFVNSIDELDKLNNTYDVNNGDVAWLIDSDGHITQYIHASWYLGRGWSPVDISSEPYVFNSIDEIFRLTGKYAPGEILPYPDGTRLIFEDPASDKIALFVFCQTPRRNDVGIFAKPVRINQFLIQNESQLTKLNIQYDLKDQAVAHVKNELGEIESTYLLYSNEWIRINAVRPFENSENVIAHLAQTGDIASISNKKPDKIFSGKDWIDRNSTYIINDISDLSLLHANEGDIAKLSGLDEGIQTYLFFDNQWHSFFQSGNAGIIDIKGSQVNMNNQSTISTSTSGNGHAGNIVLNAKAIHLNHQSLITSESLSLFAGGQAGSVIINESGSSGLLNIGAFSGVLTDSVSSGGGKISIKTNLTILINSKITTNVKDGYGNGGDISLASKQFVLNRSRVSANAIDGDGGAIFIASEYFIKSAETVIEASSERGNEGTVTIDAPDLDIDSKIMNLPTDFLNASQWMRTMCSLRDSRNASRLVFKKHTVPPKLDVYQSSR